MIRNSDAIATGEGGKVDVSERRVLKFPQIRGGEGYPKNEQEIFSRARPQRWGGVTWEGNSGAPRGRGYV